MKGNLLEKSQQVLVSAESFKPRAMAFHVDCSEIKLIYIPFSLD